MENIVRNALNIQSINYAQKDLLCKSGFEQPNQDCSTVKKGSNVLFRKVDGNAWISIERKPSGKVIGFTQHSGLSPVKMSISGVPAYLRIEDINTAKKSLYNSQLSIKGSRIEVLQGLKGGMYDPKEDSRSARTPKNVQKGQEAYITAINLAEMNEIVLLMEGLNLCDQALQSGIIGAEVLKEEIGEKLRILRKTEKKAEPKIFDGSHSKSFRPHSDVKGITSTSQNELFIVDRLGDLAREIKLSPRNKPMRSPHIKNVDGKYKCNNVSQHKSNRVVTWSSHKTVIAFDYFKLTATSYKQQCKLCNRYVKPVVPKYDNLIRETLLNEKLRQQEGGKKTDGQIEDNGIRKDQPSHRKDLCAVCKSGIEHT